MKFVSHRARFKGTLRGINISDLTDLNFKIDNSKERLEFINNKYDKVKGFYDDYTFTKEENIDGGSIGCDFSKDELTMYYKYNATTKDDLSCDINVFSACEKDASYLLNSKDIKRDRQNKYKFLSEEQFERLLHKEKSLDGMFTGEDGSIQILEPKIRNNYINTEHKIKKEDLLHREGGQVLSDYNKAKVYLKDQMEKIKKKENAEMRLYSVKRLLNGINDDMINCKIQLRGIRSQAKRLGDEGGKFYTELIDYKNIEHIKQVLKLVRFGDLEPDSELSHIAYDMQRAVSQLKKEGLLDLMDLEIIDCYNSGYNNIAIGKELGVSETAIRKRLNKIFEKISKKF